jgi:Predicted metal-dependent membrane protease
MNDQKNKDWKFTLGRVLLYCAACAVALAFFSGIMKNLPIEWSQHLLLLITTIIAFILTILFVRWEGLTLSAVGVIPGKHTSSRLLIGFLIGTGISLLQPALVMLSGKVNLVYNSGTGISLIVSHFLLYLLVACREEIAFRGYPLRSLNYSIGPFWAQVIIAIIFSLEHVAGGMTWLNAIIGSGTGAILFGVAALRTKGLALSTGLHMAWNFGQWVIGFKGTPGVWSAVVEKNQESRVEMIGSVSYLAVMSSAILAIWYFYPKDEK